MRLYSQSFYQCWNLGSRESRTPFFDFGSFFTRFNFLLLTSADSDPRGQSQEGIPSRWLSRPTSKPHGQQIFPHYFLRLGLHFIDVPVRPYESALEKVRFSTR